MKNTSKYKAMVKNKNYKYKNKFIVPGDTVIKPCTHICSKCVIDNNDHNRYPCTSHSYYPNLDYCKFPELLTDIYKKYLVSETIDGKWVCSCPRGKFHRDKDGNSTCSHVLKAKKNPDKYKVSTCVTVNKMEIADML